MPWKNIFGMTDGQNNRCYRYTERMKSGVFQHPGKDDYLLAMERSPVKDTEIKLLLKAALTDQINDREVYMKGVDASYSYKGYNTYRTSEIGDK